MKNIIIQSKQRLKDKKEIVLRWMQKPIASFKMKSIIISIRNSNWPIASQ